MTLTTIFVLSLVAVAAFLITLARVIGLRRILQHATLVDVAFTVMLAILMSGTITGLLVAITAGLLMAGVLTVLKWSLAGAEALQGRVMGSKQAHGMHKHGTTARERHPEEYTAEGVWIYNVKD